MLFILVVIVVVILLFCRNSMFELVVDCMRAGLKKKRGVEGGRSPSRGDWGGGAPPHLQTYSLSRQEKALKRDCGVLVVLIIVIIIIIVH